MALTIVNNIASLTAQANLNNTSAAVNHALERLSSGLKINRGADGPAALIISEQQRAQISGLQSAIDNTSKAVSLVQTAEGGLNEVNALLVQIRGLAVDSANIGVNDANALAANQTQINNALATINNIASQTQFGQKKLLDGTVGQQFQITSGASNVTNVAASNVTQGGAYTLNVTQAGIKGQGTAANAFTAFAQAGNANGVAVGGANQADIDQATTLANFSATNPGGVFTATVNQLGTRAYTQAGAAFTAFTGNETETLTISGAFNATITLNAGNAASLGNSGAGAIQSINQQLLAQGVTNYVAQTDASAGGTKIQFVSKAYGSQPVGISVTTAGPTGSGAGASGFATGTTAPTSTGTNLQVTVGGQTVTGSGTTNQLIQVTSGPAASLSFNYLDNDTTGAAHTYSLATKGAVNDVATFTVQGTEILTLNSTQINLNTTNANNIANAVATINSFTTQTGVTALNNGGKIQLTATKFGGSVNAQESGDLATGAFNVGLGAGGLLALGQALQGTITDQNGNASGTLTGGGAAGNVITGTTGGAQGLAFTVANSLTNSLQTVSVGSRTAVNVTDGLIFQIGANFGQTASISINKVSTIGLGVNVQGLNNSSTSNLSLIDVTDPTGKNAEDAIKVVDQAINDVSNLRGRLGAFQTNTLQANAQNLQVSLQNTTSAESTIRDTDFAAETANFTKNQVLLQAGTSVLANANQLPSLVLALLK